MELTVFNFNDQEVRTQKTNDQVWFCLKDICNILEIKNYRDTLTRLNQKGVAITDTLTNGGVQKMTFINESNLYKVIFQSRKPQAEKFTEWVTGEVLPTIRKTGRYEVPRNPMDALKLMFEAQTQTNERLDDVEKEVVNLKENCPLAPGEYNYLNNAVRTRVKYIKQVRNLQFINRKQNSRLYASINHDLNAYVGIKTRTQIRQKDFNKALDFIRSWEPSYTDMKLIEQLALEI